MGGAAQYFQDTNGDLQLAYQNMSKSADGLRFAIENGLTDSVAKYNAEAPKMRDNLNLMSDSLRNNIQSLDANA